MQLKFKSCYCQKFHEHGTRGYSHTSGERPKWHNHFGKHVSSDFFFFFLLIFVIAKIWKQLKYHLPRWWIKIIFIHKIEHYLIIKKSEHHVNAKHTCISKTVLEWKKPDKNICTIWYVWYEIQKCIISKNMRREIYLKGSTNKPVGMMEIFYTFIGIFLIWFYVHSWKCVGLNFEDFYFAQTKILPQWKQMFIQNMTQVFKKHGLFL